MSTSEKIIRVPFFYSMENVNSHYNHKVLSIVEDPTRSSWAFLLTYNLEEVITVLKPTQPYCVTVSFHKPPNSSEKQRLVKESEEHLDSE